MNKASLLLSSFILLLSLRSQAQEDSTRYVMGGDLRVSGMGGMLFHIGDMSVGDRIYTSVGGGGGLLIGQSLMLGGYGQGLTNEGVPKP